jgi:hypothetical protein
MWLVIEAVLRCHPHQRMDEADVLLRDDIDAIRSILLE